MGYQVPAGISDATVPNPIFNLTPAATVDEGNTGSHQLGSAGRDKRRHQYHIGNYAPAAGSPVINYIPSTATANFTKAPDSRLLQ